MRIGIIGAGAVGMLLAGYLEKMHEVVVFPQRMEQQNLLNKKGIQINDSSVGTIKANVKAALLDDRLPSLDCCFICVKQSKIATIMAVLHQSPSDLPLIFVQNGMGHLDALKTLRQPVYIGIVSHGVKRLNDGMVSHKGKGNILIAAFQNDNGELNSLVKTLHQNDFPFEMAQDWLPIMKNKMLVNSVINPLTALFQVPNEMILTNEPILKLAKKLCLESATVLQLEYEEAWENVAAIAVKTGSNTSSMLQDLQGGKETEIKAISGYLLHKTSLPLPYTSFVYESILALERKEKQI